MSFLDDLGEFGSGALDNVGEGFGTLVKNYTTEDQTTNSGITQQPVPPVKDDHGNAVTGSLLTAPDKTLLYVGGGLGVVLVLIGLVIALKS